MKLSLSKQQLTDYVITQANGMFPDGNNIPKEVVASHIDHTVQRIEYCFSKVNSKYYYDGTNVLFNHLNGDQYASFLYFLSNTLYKEGQDSNFCAKLFLLNKALHGLDAFYEVSLPDIFLLVHPMATVLGRGTYADYFIAYQRCGIGSNHNVYPQLGKFVTLHPGSAVLGNSIIGNNCKIAAESLVLDKNIEENSVYIGNPKEFFIHKSEKPSDFWIL